MRISGSTSKCDRALSGSLYATLSLTIKVFEKLEVSCQNQLEHDNGVLSSITAAMLKKLEHYS